MKDNFGQILDVFTSDEIGFLIKMLAEIPMQNYGRVDTYNNGFTDKDIVFPQIEKFVIKRINEKCARKINRIAVGMQLITKNPYGIHTDRHKKGDSGQGTAYLIPLWTKPITKENSFTIIFNEGYIASNSLADYVATGPSLPKNNAEFIWDQIPHNGSYAYMKYLSVGLIGYWHPGSVIYWDRSLFHASDDFHKKGIEEKSALVIFATDDE